MKINILLSILMLLSTVSNAQRVGINSVQIDSSAVMEIKSDSLGILIPRLDSLNIFKILLSLLNHFCYTKNMEKKDLNILMDQNGKL